MNKTKSRRNSQDADDMLPEYDFRGLKADRGKYYLAIRDGYTITIHKQDGTSIVKEIKPKRTILLETDVQKYFPDSKSVNHALRSLIPEIRQKRAAMSKESKGVYKTWRTAQ